MSASDKMLKELKKLMAIFKGEPVKRDMLLNPSNAQTSSFLTASQVSYVQDAFWLAEQYPEFEPLKQDAMQLLLTRLSYEGKGVMSTIDLMKALTVQEKWFEMSAKEAERRSKGQVKTGEGD